MIFEGSCHNKCGTFGFQPEGSPDLKKTEESASHHLFDTWDTLEQLPEHLGQSKMIF